MKAPVLILAEQAQILQPEGLRHKAVEMPDRGNAQGSGFGTLQAARQGQVELELLQNVRIAIGRKQLALTRGQAFGAAAGNLCLGQGCAQGVKDHHNLCRKLPTGRTFLLDEEETYEGASIRTLTMPVLMERDTWFVVATAVGSTRRLAAAGTARRRWQDKEEQKHGPRPDQSRECVSAVMKSLDGCLDGGSLVLRSDEKSSYPTVAKEIFGERVKHEQTSGRNPRTVFNPLFPINTTLAMTRDNCGRLRRKSWLVTKKGVRLQLHMQQFVVYRNYVRKRFNRDKEPKSPAVHLELIPRSLTLADAIRWRQHWGLLSIHPLSLDGRRRVGEAFPLTA